MIFRSNINQTYKNQFQIGTEKLNIQKHYEYLGGHLTENLTLAYLSSKGKGMSGWKHNTVLYICVIRYRYSKHTVGIPI